jgi:hypothetical protein
MKTLAMLVLVLWGAVAMPAAAQNTSAWSEGGLVKKDVPGIDTAYVLPGASLGEYKKVLLKPVQVSFRRGFLEQPLPGSKFRMSPRDAQDIRDKVAKLLQDEFRKELSAGGYQLTDAPGEDTLAIEAAVVNLYVAAPKATAAPAQRTIALSAGEMSLVAQFSDSLSGDVLARVFDYASAHETTRGQTISSVDNEVEARRIVSEWAKILRRSFDAAHGMK